MAQFWNTNCQSFACGHSRSQPFWIKASMLGSFVVISRGYSTNNYKRFCMIVIKCNSCILDGCVMLILLFIVTRSWRRGSFVHFDLELTFLAICWGSLEVEAGSPSWMPQCKTLEDPNQSPLFAKIWSIRRDPESKSTLTPNVHWRWNFPSRLLIS